MIRSPFQWFGGKSRVAAEVWARLGDVDRYVEPFFGGGTVMLSRHHTGERTETVNDLDCMVANFWRAAKVAPDAVAEACDWPCNEADLVARHVWLLNRKPALAERCQADPDYYDAKAAGWWVWGQCWWIGSGWCDGRGPWNIGANGLLARTGNGVSRQLPQLAGIGRGVNRKLPQPDDAGACAAYSEFIRAYIRSLSDRLRRVRVCCGDWSRVVSPSAAVYPPSRANTVGVFLDPPYSFEAGRGMGCYAEDDGECAHDVREWCKTVDQDRRLRLALCGYDTEHAELEARGWSVFAWSTRGGMSNMRKRETPGAVNAKRERIWFSPGCLAADDGPHLFSEPGATPRQR